MATRKFNLIISLSATVLAAFIAASANATVYNVDLTTAEYYDAAVIRLLDPRGVEVWNSRDIFVDDIPKQFSLPNYGAGEQLLLTDTDWESQQAFSLTDTPSSVKILDLSFTHSDFQRTHMVASLEAPEPASLCLSLIAGGFMVLWLRRR